MDKNVRRAAAGCGALILAMSLSREATGFDLTPPPLRRFDNAQQLDAALHDLLQRSWQIYQGDYTHRTDVRGRTAAQDVVEYLLAPKREQRLKELLAQAREQAQKKPKLRATLDEAALLVQQEDYRSRMLNDYWWWQVWIAQHEDNLLWLAGRLAADDPAERQARMAPPIERLGKELANALTLSSSVQQRTALLVMDAVSGLIFQVLNEERGKLAVLVSERDREQGKALTRERRAPCPPATWHTSGVERPKIGASSAPTEEFYPTDTKTAHFEGSVEVNALVSASGCMQKATIYQSSGVAALDEAALRWTESASFDPAERDHQPIDGTLSFRVKFQMTRKP